MTLNAIIANFQTFKLVDLLDIIIISFRSTSCWALSTVPVPASCSRVRCW